MPTARDGYVDYYTEKLWEWLPAIYREQDAQDGPGLPNHVLRALIVALAEQAAVLKRDQDRLWDDGFVELADDWAIPYLAELLSTRLVSVLNPRARRVDVAKTVYYRRRKGTLTVLEQLMDDMAAWDGKIVEEFRRLGRTPHGLDGVVGKGRITATPEGGLADLRSVRGALLAQDPFCEFHFTPDMRRPGGLLGSRLGQRGITKLSLHVYRTQAVEFSGVQPCPVEIPGGSHPEYARYTFDPSGRDVALFCANQPDKDWSQWHSAAEWQLPREMNCRLLGEAIYEVNEAVVDAVLNSNAIANLADRQNAAADMRKLLGMRFVGTLAGSKLFFRILWSMPSTAFLQQALPEIFAPSLVRDCGAVQLYPDSVMLGYRDGTAVDRVGIRAAQLPDLKNFKAANDLLVNVTALIDPGRGRLLWDVGARAAGDMRVAYHVGMLGAFGAGGLEREIAASAAALSWQAGDSSPGVPVLGAVNIEDSSTFVDPPDQLALENCSVAAREGERPYLLLKSDWQFSASGGDSTLLLDGLWVGGAVGLGAPANIVLDGNFGQVTLRYCTLDPGGVNASGENLPPVALVVRGLVQQLVLQRCILSCIQTDGATASIERITLEDSVVHCASGLALNAPTAHVILRRSTIIAPSVNDLALHVEWLDASDCIVAGRADVTNTQSGCFRFSACGSGSLLPHPYESAVLDSAATTLGRLFASLRFGDASYASLSPAAPQALLRGAEQGLEMGAFNARALPIKQDSLRIKVDEYLPFGRLPNYITEN